MHLAVAAILNGLWDLWARLENKPLWRLLADMEPEVSHFWLIDARLCYQITFDAILLWKVFFLSFYLLRRPLWLRNKNKHNLRRMDSLRLTINLFSSFFCLFSLSFNNFLILQKILKQKKKIYSNSNCWVVWMSLFCGHLARCHVHFIFHFWFASRQNNWIGLWPSLTCWLRTTE